MSRLFKSLPSIKPTLTIERLSYGIGFEDGKYHIYIRKQKRHWVRRYGPFTFKLEADRVIQNIKDEYNAVRAKQS